MLKLKVHKLKSTKNIFKFILKYKIYMCETPKRQKYYKSNVNTLLFLEKDIIIIIIVYLII